MKPVLSDNLDQHVIVVINFIIIIIAYVRIIREFRGACGVVLGVRQQDGAKPLVVQLRRPFKLEL